MNFILLKFFFFFFTSHRQMYVHTQYTLIQLIFKYSIVVSIKKKPRCYATRLSRTTVQTKTFILLKAKVICFISVLFLPLYMCMNLSFFISLIYNK